MPQGVRVQVSSPPPLNEKSDMSKVSRVLKFEVNLGTNAIEVPAGSRVLHFGVNHGLLYVWIYVSEEMDTGDAKESKKTEISDALDDPNRSTIFITIYGTGDHVNLSPSAHIGTVVTPAKFVWHAFRGLDPLARGRASC